MNYSILFTVLAISSVVVCYGILVFKLSEWCFDNVNEYCGFFVWMIGYGGLPLAILAGLFAR